MTPRARYVVLALVALAGSYAAFLVSDPSHRAKYETLACFLLNGLVLGLAWNAACRTAIERQWTSATWSPLVGAGVVAAAGYLLFWFYFASPWLGRLGSAAIVGVSVVRLSLRAAPPPAATDAAWAEVRTVARTMAAIGFFYVALLHLYPTTQNFYDLAANRLREELPSDNRLPHDTLEPMYRGERRRDLGPDWLTSDRPPLESGWELITYPLSAGLRTDAHALSGTAALWLQLLWVPAAYGLLRQLGVAVRRSVWWIVLLGLTGFFAQNTVFTWPKLSAGAFGCGAFALWFLPLGRPRRSSDFVVGAGLASLAWLSHGGIAFSLLGLAPWVFGSVRRHGIRPWLAAAAVFLAFALPWFAFQKFYNPPGDRLLKMHLGGQLAQDPRPVLDVIRTAYRAKSFDEILSNKLANARMLTLGTWPALFDFTPAQAVLRRNDEFFCTFRAMTWWLVSPLALFVAWAWRRTLRIRSSPAPESPAPPGRVDVALLAWTALTLVLWCLLMFGPYATSIHQGSYAILLCLFVVASAWLEHAGRWWIVPVALLQIATFATTWAAPNAHLHGPARGWPLLLAGVAGLVAVAMTAGRESPAIDHDASPGHDASSP